MSKLFQFYRIINVLSLDVVVGAVVSALFFSKIFSVVTGPFELIALGCTVWLVYTADHLRDAKNLKHQASTDRHRFHQRHYKTLSKVLLGVVALDAFATVFIQKEVLLWGVVLATAVGIYLVVHRSLKFLKEFFIATLYTCGIVLPSVAMTHQEINLIHYLLIFHFFILALINLLLFSWFDRELDQQDRHHSFVTITGEKVTGKIIWLLIVLQLLLTLLQIYWGQYLQAAILLGSAGLIFVVIMIFRKSFRHHDYYRFVGDAAFIIPILYLI
jgi:4-hydroxybenzoate polyprenyltransferase